jgi:hypothetical protein
MSVIERFSPTKLRTFVTCERKYKYQYIDRLAPLIYQRPLEFGSMGHTILEKYYIHKQLTDDGKESSFSLTDILAEIREAREAIGFSGNTVQFFEQDMAALEGMLIAYVAKYNNFEKDYHILGVEQRILSEQRYAGIQLEGIIDALWTDENGKHWVVDHKFMSRINETWVRKMPLDYQTHTYIKLANEWLAAKGLDPVRGILFNVIKKPTKRLKQKQSIREYMMEISSDYIERPGEFYHRVPVIVTTQHRADFEEFLNRVSADMLRAHELESFRQNVYQCDVMGVCPFLELCLHGKEALHYYKTRTPR